MCWFQWIGKRPWKKADFRRKPAFEFAEFGTKTEKLVSEASANAAASAAEAASTATEAAAAEATASGSTTSTAAGSINKVEGRHVADLREKRCRGNSNVSAISRNDRKRGKAGTFGELRDLGLESDSVSASEERIASESGSTTSGETQDVTIKITQDLSGIGAWAAKLAENDLLIQITLNVSQVSELSLAEFFLTLAFLYVEDAQSIFLRQ